MCVCCWVGGHRREGLGLRRLVLMVGTRPAERRREEGEAGVLVHFHSLMPVSGDFFLLFMY